MAIEFDPQCGTAQPEDVLRLLIPSRSMHFSGLGSKSLAHETINSWTELKKFSGSSGWPTAVLVLPGNSDVPDSQIQSFINVYLCFHADEHAVDVSVFVYVQLLKRTHLLRCLLNTTSRPLSGSLHCQQIKHYFVPQRVYKHQIPIRKIWGLFLECYLCEDWIICAGATLSVIFLYSWDAIFYLLKMLKQFLSLYFPFSF